MGWLLVAGARLALLAVPLAWEHKRVTLVTLIALAIAGAAMGAADRQYACWSDADRLFLVVTLTDDQYAASRGCYPYPEVMTP